MFITGKALEAGNPQDDYILIKEKGTKDYLIYKSRLIFGPEFGTMFFLSVIFFFDIISAGEYVTACAVYMGGNTVNKVADIAGQIGNMPTLRKILGNNGGED
jgi:hypothetical protein